MMATKAKQPQMSRRQQRKLRTQQIIFGVIAVLVILAMIIPSLAQ
jgi:predicted nucleic acid-binding Zn ribbon protein